MFGRKKSSARQKYRDFVIAGIENGRRDDLVGGGLRRSRVGAHSGDGEAYDERILGSGEFVEALWRVGQSREISRAKMSVMSPYH
jgi:hypothetical protein